LISGIQKTELFPLLNAQREGIRWLRLFDYTPHLISTSRLFWKYNCLLEASDFLRCQQSLAEAQYSGKFKLKFVRTEILVTHPVYLVNCIFNGIYNYFISRGVRLLIEINPLDASDYLSNTVEILIINDVIINMDNKLKIVYILK